ncbi:halocin C8-like domain-containing protein [Natronorubrum sediminis]|nr:halocin C8-like domain-containing protein [Natronorubrum sediminis]
MLKSIGVGVSSIASISVSAAALEGDEDDPITILEGGNKRSVARELEQTEQYGSLARKAEERGQRIVLSATNIDAARVENDDFKREVVSYDLLDTDEGVDAAIIIARDLKTSAVEFAQLDYYHTNSDGVLTEIERFEAATDVERTQEGKTTPEEGIKLTTHEVDPAVFAQFSAAFDDNTVSTQFVDVPSDFPTEWDITGCNSCYEIARLTCRYLCGAAGGFACGVLGITVVGGIGCATFVAGVCRIADAASGCGDDLAKTICTHDAIGACDDDAPGRIINVDIPDFDDIV